MEMTESREAMEMSDFDWKLAKSGTAMLVTTKEMGMVR